MRGRASRGKTAAKPLALDGTFPPSRARRKSDARLIATAGPFKVTSHVGGHFQITAAWAGEIPKGCKYVSPENYCHEHGCYHIGGVFTRMAIAEAIQALLASLSPAGAKHPGGAAEGRG